jgi:hypothetical protein
LEKAEKAAGNVSQKGDRLGEQKGSSAPRLPAKDDAYSDDDAGYDNENFDENADSTKGAVQADNVGDYSEQKDPPALIPPTKEDAYSDDDAGYDNENFKENPGSTKDTVQADNVDDGGDYSEQKDPPALIPPTEEDAYSDDDAGYDNENFDENPGSAKDAVQADNVDDGGDYSDQKAIKLKYHPSAHVFLLLYYECPKTPLFVLSPFPPPSQNPF